MKMFTNRLGPVAVLAGVTLLGGLPHSSAESGSRHRPGTPDLDLRPAVVVPSARLAEKNAGVNALAQRLPGAKLTFDRLLDSPSFIRAGSGFLTGPGGSGLAVSSAGARGQVANDPHRGVKAFLNEHTALFGHDAGVLADAAIARESVGAHNGLRTVVWQQQYAGLPVFNSVLIGNLTAQGELVSLGSHFLPDPAAAAAGVTPASASLSTEQALLAAYGSLTETVAGPEITATGAAGNGFNKLSVRGTTVHARLVWLPMNRTSLRLAYELCLRSLRTRELLQVLVDAESGEVLLRRNLMRDISDATYNVYTSDSPSPFSPGWPTPNTAQPPLTNRVLVTLSAFDVNASPNGWINDADNETQGNNVDAFTDRDFDQQPDGPRPQGNPTRVFDFTLDLTQAPLSYTNAATVQLFYLNNLYHDRLYQFGFTEAAGNFQNDNFGRGGLGNDRVISYVQSGADVGIANNAMFGTPPDGISGEMYMFVFSGPNPDRDGDLDADVVWHEFTHGLSGRLVGGGVGIGALQTGGMGEGWSDFVALSLLSESGDDPDAVYAEGGYPTFQFFGLTENYYYGIRHFPYSTDMAKNPFTFKDIDPTQISPHPGVPRSPIYPFNANEASEVHHQGEVWCVTLWDVRANLIHKHGFAGNQLMLQLVVDGMKLGPANPTFLEARDAILLADLVNNGGANVGEIWAGFAKRGMGVSAIAPDSDTTTGVIEAFDVPGLQIVSQSISGGNGNGLIDVNECNLLDIVLQNNNAFTASGISIRLSSRTPGVAFGNKVASYPDIPTGTQATNLIPFSVSTAPDFVCGTPIVLDVVIKSDQATSITTLTFQTGTVGAPVRFDSTQPAAIPDANPTGTNSPIVVSNITSALGKVAVSLYLTHTFDADLTLALISPEGVTNILSAGHGFGGDNYGANCFPDSLRTTFDDDAAATIGSGAAPFLGSYKPDQPLTVFVGKSGTNVNGTWSLRVVDSFSIDVGVLNCWSLHLYPAECEDGGGTCPGSDLAIGIKDTPDPVFVGSNLVYTITVTNFGPSAAKNTIVNHVLPPSTIFVSAVSSQGSCVNAGGTVVCNLGILPFGSVATITVTVLPTTVGLASSTVNVSSSEPEPDNSNNSAIAVTHVNPPTAELALGLADAPDPALIGGTLTYTVSVTNNGPSTASGVTVTNTLPLSVIVQGASASQGFSSINGNSVIFSLGSLTAGGRAGGTITVSPTAEGTIVANAKVAANQTDPIVANNSVSAATIVGPAADLKIGVTDLPDPVVVRSNWTYTISVTNGGPSIANNVVLNASLPAGINLVSTNTSQGSLTLSPNSLSASLGTLANGAFATVTLVVNATNSGNYSLTATVSSSAADPDAANSSASVTTTVAPPNVTIVAAGATLTAESLLPANGGLDNGETVTLTLRLRNAGNVNNTNLVATLLATNGVTAPSGAQNYGVLAPSDVPVGRAFTFTAAGVNGGPITPTLLLQDGPSNLGLVAFNFTLSNVRSYSNTTPITINDPASDPGVAAASVYPSTIVVSGLTGLVGRVSVTLSNLNHTFLEDVDVLLVGPNAQKVMLLSDAGGPNSAVNTSVSFDDAGATLPDESQVLSTTYAPGDYEIGDTFPGPAPVGPYGTALSAFNGISGNGTWSLYVVDDHTGDIGSIASGWRLALTTVSAVNQLADLRLTVAAPSSATVGSLLTYTFTVTNAGPNIASGIAFSDSLPGSVTLVSAAASQGSVTTNSSSVQVSLGSLSVGASATVSVAVLPGAAGQLLNSGTVSASEIDLNPADNTAAASTSVTLPDADLGVAISAAATAVLGSNVTYTVSLTNAGPGTALNVLVSDPLPAGMSFVSASSSAGTATNASGTVVAGVGNLAAGATATITIVAQADTVGAKLNTVDAANASNDANPADNSAAAVVTVNPPAPLLVAAGATLLSESFAPANGTVDIGETVTVALAVQNTGTANTTNLWGLLQTTGGVTAPSAPKNYGVLVAGGPASAQNFTFTATGTNGGVVTASLLLDDQGPVGFATFQFNLPAAATFANTNTILIPDHGAASAYPSVINVSGLGGLIGKVTVTLNGLTHGFPDDLDLLLVSPNGQKVVVQSDAGGGHALTNLTLTLDDAQGALPDSLPITAGSHGPADYESGEVFPAPAPAGSSGSALSLFNGADANGDWSLYLVDDATGDAGIVTGGWSLTITTIQTVNPVADLAVTLSDAPDPVFVGSALTYTITVTNRGPAAASGVSLSDVLPLGVSYVSSTTSLGTVGAVGQSVTANIGNLAAGSGALVTIRTAPASSGATINTVSATGSQSDINPLNNSAQTTTQVNAPAAARFVDVVFAGGTLQATLVGEPGQSYVISGSPDFSTWTPIVTATTAVNGTYKFTDSGTSGQGARYYRAVRVIP